MVPSVSSSANTTSPDPTADYIRLSHLERETRHFNERFEEMQHQLDNVTRPSHVASTHTQGRLVVQNRTGVPHYLSVYKVQHYIQPGRADIWVPYQAMEAYLPSHELPKLFGMSFWRRTGWDYAMFVETKN